MKGKSSERWLPGGAGWEGRAGGGGEDHGGLTVEPRTRRRKPDQQMGTQVPGPFTTMALGRFSKTRVRANRSALRVVKTLVT